VLLCRSLPVELALVDFDRVETKNLHAQAFVKQSLGKNKAEALKLQLYNLYGRKCDAFGVRLSADNVETLSQGADLLVDCFVHRQMHDAMVTLRSVVGQ
jgi:molybdopterin/thiamine biosynthesis adenylyltransferase